MKIVTIYKVWEDHQPDGMYQRVAGTYRDRKRADEVAASFAYPKSFGGRVEEIECLEIDGRLFELGREVAVERTGGERG